MLAGLCERGRLSEAAEVLRKMPAGAAREALLFEKGKGGTALAHAVGFWACPLSLVELMLSHFPPPSFSPSLLSLSSSFPPVGSSHPRSPRSLLSRLPLHTAARHSGSLPLLKLLIRENPGALAVRARDFDVHMGEIGVVPLRYADRYSLGGERPNTQTVIDFLETATRLERAKDGRSLTGLVGFSAVQRYSHHYRANFLLCLQSILLAVDRGTRTVLDTVLDEAGEANRPSAGKSVDVRALFACYVRAKDVFAVILTFAV